MIIRDLYKTVLLDPAKEKGRQLFAISGYSSATFTRKHLTDTGHWDAKVNLLIGMPGNRSDHLGFLSVVDDFGDRFNGYYFRGSPWVHCKAYGWFQHDVPISGYSGSANYSNEAFVSERQINQLTGEKPEEIRKLFDQLVINSIPLKDYRPDEPLPDLSPVGLRTITDGSVAPGAIHWEIPDKRVRISFLDNQGNLPARSGLNWGQRPDLGREPNQAYLGLRQDTRDLGFLPPLAETFTLITDDQKSFDCVVAQQNRKAIHSTLNNSEIGAYVRLRIGVPLGQLVRREDLEAYGRTDYTLEKLNQETFLLDLSVN